MTPVPHPPGMQNPDIYDHIFHQPEVFDMQNFHKWKLGGHWDWSVCIPEKYLSKKFKDEFGNS